MTAHVADRLSAYLDHELSVVDAAAVREHLAGCEACASRLAQLAAVDGLLRELPAEAPPSYFDSFALRVRTRIETTHRPRVPLRVPAWTWAVAAAVLVAVVLPLTTLERHARPSPAPAKAPGPATTMPAQARADGPPPVPAAEADRLGVLGYTQAPPADAKTRAKAEPEPTSAVAAGAPALLKRGADPRIAGAPVATPPALTAAGQEEAVQAEKAVLAGFEDSSGVQGSVPREGRTLAAEARHAAPPERPEEQTASRRAASAGTMAEPPLSSADLEYRALESRAAGTSLARQRDAWRGFALRHSADPRADEARVRVVALGVDIAMRTGAEGDRAQALKDAADYLARKDAAQKERVHILVRNLAR